MIDSAMANNFCVPACSDVAACANLNPVVIIDTFCCCRNFSIASWFFAASSESSDCCCSALSLASVVLCKSAKSLSTKISFPSAAACAKFSASVII